MRCDGWYEWAHKTSEPVSVIVSNDGLELHLCPCCAVDLLNDARIPEAHKQVAHCGGGLTCSLLNAPLRQSPLPDSPLRPVQESGAGFA